MELEAAAGGSWCSPCPMELERAFGDGTPAVVIVSYTLYSSCRWNVRRGSVHSDSRPSPAGRHRPATSPVCSGRISSETCATLRKMPRLASGRSIPYYFRDVNTKPNDFSSQPRPRTPRTDNVLLRHDLQCSDAEPFRPRRLAGLAAATTLVPARLHSDPRSGWASSPAPSRSSRPSCTKAAAKHAPLPAMPHADRT